MLEDALGLRSTDVVFAVALIPVLAEIKLAIAVAASASTASALTKLTSL